MKAKSRPLEREPAGIDQFMLEKPSEEALALYKSEDKTIAAVDKLIKSNNKDAAQIRTKTQVRPGYDLLRVGNYHEDPAYPLPDIAFFHHRLSMDKVPQREALIRSACLALRELCVTVFDYDARLVTLFFEEGPVSLHSSKDHANEILSSSTIKLSRACLSISNLSRTPTSISSIHKLGKRLDCAHYSLGSLGGVLFALGCSLPVVQ